MSDAQRTNEVKSLLSTPRFDIVRRGYRTADGTWHAREVIEHPGAVTVLPLRGTEHVCLVENFRVAVDQVLVELPAGTLEPGEDPLNTAHRELEEETGYVAGQMRQLSVFYMSPGILNERMVLFVATDLTPGRKHLDQGEQIENLIVPWQTALAWIDEGRIQDAKTIVGLLHYDRLRRQGE